MYALIEIAGKQYKVEDGVSIKVPRLNGKVGSKYSVDKVLYLEDGEKKIIGSPFVKGKKLQGEIVSHERGRKVVVFKFKRRKGYQTKNTHRREYTVLKFGKLNAVKKKTVAKKDTSIKATNKETRQKTDKIKKEEK